MLFHVSVTTLCIWGVLLNQLTMFIYCYSVVRNVGAFYWVLYVSSSPLTFHCQLVLAQNWTLETIILWTIRSALALLYKWVILMLAKITLCISLHTMNRIGMIGSMHWDQVVNKLTVHCVIFISYKGFSVYSDSWLNMLLSSTVSF